jgi:hypothetical protein
VLWLPLVRLLLSDVPRREGKVIDITGKRFGMLTVVRRDGNFRQPGGHEFPAWLCQCDCGSVSRRRAYDLRRSTKSCGCARGGKVRANRTIHGQAAARTGAYKSWMAMRKRCLSTTAINYANYGGRGIKVCQRWDSFENFLADMGPRPEGLTLERINNEGDYEPSNCKWATYKEQGANRRKPKERAR